MGISLSGCTAGRDMIRDDMLDRAVRRVIDPVPSFWRHVTDDEALALLRGPLIGSVANIRAAFVGLLAWLPPPPDLTYLDERYGFGRPPC